MKAIFTEDRVYRLSDSVVARHMNNLYIELCNAIIELYNYRDLLMKADPIDYSVIDPLDVKIEHIKLAIDNAENAHN